MFFDYIWITKILKFIYYEIEHFLTYWSTSFLRFQRWFLPMSHMGVWSSFAVSIIYYAFTTRSYETVLRKINKWPIVEF